MSFTIGPTDFVYLIGATGSGKAVYLKTLYAELPLKKGQGEIIDYQLFQIKRSLIPFFKEKNRYYFSRF